MGGVQEVIRGIAIHHYFAGRDAHTQPLRLFEQGVDRLGKYRAVDTARGDAIFQALIEKHFRNRCGESLVGVFTLCWEGVLVQPVQKLLTKGRNHRRLRKMHMAVEKTGRYQRVGPVVAHLDPRREFTLYLVRRPEVGDNAVAESHNGIRFVDHGVFQAVLERIALES